MPHFFSINKSIFGPDPNFCRVWHSGSNTNSTDYAIVRIQSNPSPVKCSSLPGIKVTMRFCFKLGLVLVTSDCGITADCYVDRSVNTNTAHACAFYETKTVCKNAKFHAYTLFFSTNSHNQCCNCWGFFTRIWGFPVSSGVLGFLLKIWGLFDSGQILEMYVALLYFPFKNTVVS